MASDGGTDSGHEQRVHLVRGARVVFSQDAEQSPNFDSDLRRTPAEVKVYQLSDQTLEVRDLRDFTSESEPAIRLLASTGNTSATGMYDVYTILFLTL